MSSTTALSRLCTSNAAGDGLGREPRRARIGQPAGKEKPQILLGADDGDGLCAGIRRDDDFGEDFGDGARRLRVERAIERDDAAERRGLVAGEGLAISVDQTFAFGDAARIGVLDDGASRTARRIEFGDAFVSGVGVVDVVVGELLALGLARGGDAEAHDRRAIERGRLVRVLAVAQWLDQPAAEGAIVRRGVVKRLREPVADGGIVGCGAGKGLGGEFLAQRKRGHAVMRGELVEQRRVIARLDQYHDVVMVLRRGTDHGRPADVDILDAVGEIATARHSRFERIEIDHQNIDGADAVRAHRFGVLGVAADRQQSAVYARMQRLDAAVHHFRKSGQFADVEHLESGIARASSGCRRSKPVRCRSPPMYAPSRRRRLCQRRK